MSVKVTQLYNKNDIKVMISKIADAILKDIQKNNLDQLAFIGIQSRGVPLARKIADEVQKKCNQQPPLAILDINMYRDDLGIRKTLPHINPTDVPFDLDEKIIILVDDVLHTGRTIRAALDAITDYGRPDFIKLAVLIDREVQEFPIKADYIGDNITIKQSEIIKVLWEELDKKEGVYISPSKTT